jgi:hypothetical protein
METFRDVPRDVTFSFSSMMIDRQEGHPLELGAIYVIPCGWRKGRGLRWSE